MIISGFPSGGGGVQIETGTYVGTGTYGEANSNTLTFGFTPKLVMIVLTTRKYVRENFTDISSGVGFYAWGNDVITYFNSLSSGVNKSGDFSAYSYSSFASANGNTMSWYSPVNASRQLNEAETTISTTRTAYAYEYIAIG